MSADIRSRLEAMRRLVKATSFDAQVSRGKGGGVAGAFYLKRDDALSIGDGTWGAFVEHYNPLRLNAVFLERSPKGGDVEVARDQRRDSSVIVVDSDDAKRAGVNFLNADGTLDTSGRWVVGEKYPLNFEVEDLVVRHLAGRPWRYVFILKEAESHHRIATGTEVDENLTSSTFVNGSDLW